LVVDIALLSTVVCYLQTAECLLLRLEPLSIPLVLELLELDLLGTSLCDEAVVIVDRVCGYIIPISEQLLVSAHIGHDS
jgi:hypothetical protein